MTVFEIIDKTGRKIRLTEKQWKHILRRHSDMINYLEEIKLALENPLKIEPHQYDENGRYYFSYVKNKPSPYQKLLVIVKYLNGDGFIISSYFEKN